MTTISDKLDSIVRLIKAKFTSNKLKLATEEKGFLLSLSIIGRDLVYRRIDQIMDIDIVIVVSDPMTKQKYNTIDNIFSELQELSDSEVSVSYKIADGPIKPKVTKKVNLFLHVLLHTISSYKNSPLILVKNSWQYDAHKIIGVDLVEIQKINEPSLYEIIYGKLGIAHCIELVESKSSAYLEWLRKNKDNQMSLNLSSIIFDERCEIIEICYYAVLRAASNSLRYVLGHSWGIGIDPHDMEIFKKTFLNFKYNDLPLNYALEKIELRKGLRLPSNNDLSIITEKTITFLKSLKNHLSETSDLKSLYN